MKTTRVRVKLDFELEYDKPIDEVPASLATTDINRFIIAGIQATSSAPEGAVARREESRITHVVAGADLVAELVHRRRRRAG